MKQAVKTLTTYMPPELFVKVKADADAKGQPLSVWMIRAAILRLETKASNEETE